MTTGIGEDLAKTRLAITKEDWKAALTALLAAWQTSRSPRVAELVDRVAQRLPSAPIPGKTLKARLATWAAIASQKDSADVGTLLATPWPVRWQDNVPLIASLAAYPPDPRIAFGVAKRLTEADYNSWECVGFFQPAAELVARLADMRTKPLLDDALARTQNFNWERRVRPIVYEAAVAIAEPPPLTSEDTSALAALEGSFAGEVASAKTTAKSEADLLAVIYAAPADDTPRAVYADWLGEKGDPRGEFITLQLAANPSEAAKKRVAALLKKHGAKWAGPLDRVFDKEDRTFTRGFLSGGLTVDYAHHNLPRELHHPEWALVEEFRCPQLREPTSAGLLEAPWLRNLRVLTGVAEMDVLEIAARAPRLEELHFIALDETHDVATARRTKLAEALSQLKILGIGGRTEDVLAYFGSPLPASLSRLVITTLYEPIAAFVAARKALVPVLEFRSSSKWRFELRRDAHGHFTRVLAGPTNPSRPVPEDDHLFVRALGALTNLTELVVHGTECSWNVSTLAGVEEAITAHPSLRHIEVPWDRGVGKPAFREQYPLRLTLRQTHDIANDIDTYWGALRALEFDSLSRNEGAHLPFEGELARVKKELGRRGTHQVRLYRKDQPATVFAELRERFITLGMARDENWRLDAFLVWLRALLDRVPVDHVYGYFLKRTEGGGFADDHSDSLGSTAPPLAWITSFREGAGYVLDEVKDIATRTLKDCRVVRTKNLLLVVASPSPDQRPSAAESDALAIELGAVYWRDYEKQHAFSPPTVAAELLTPALEERGFTVVPKGWAKGDTLLRLDYRFSDKGDLHIELTDGARRVRITRFAVGNREQATDAFTSFVAKLDEHLAKP